VRAKAQVGRPSDVLRRHFLACISYAPRFSGFMRILFRTGCERCGRTSTRLVGKALAGPRGARDTRIDYGTISAVYLKLGGTSLFCLCIQPLSQRSRFGSPQRTLASLISLRVVPHSFASWRAVGSASLRLCSAQCSVVAMCCASCQGRPLHAGLIRPALPYAGTQRRQRCTASVILYTRLHASSAA
jgi:hypothetical protein